MFFALNLLSFVNLCTGLSCYHCFFTKTYYPPPNSNESCMNASKLNANDTRICSPKEQMCMVEAALRNGIPLSLKRDCSGDCPLTCISRGFGIFEQSCSRCCNESLCNVWRFRDIFEKENSWNRDIILLLSLAVVLATIIGFTLCQ